MALVLFLMPPSVTYVKCRAFLSRSLAQRNAPHIKEMTILVIFNNLSLSLSLSSSACSIGEAAFSSLSLSSSHSVIFAALPPSPLKQS